MEKALKSEDRSHKGLEIDPEDILKGYKWRKDGGYDKDNESKIVYVKHLDALMWLMGVEFSPMAESKVWRGWTWKRGGKNK